jgi:hypothetical protein
LVWLSYSALAPSIVLAFCLPRFVSMYYDRLSPDVRWRHMFSRCLACQLDIRAVTPVVPLLFVNPIKSSHPIENENMPCRSTFGDELVFTDIGGK